MVTYRLLAIWRYQFSACLLSDCRSDAIIILHFNADFVLQFFSMYPAMGVALYRRGGSMNEHTECDHSPSPFTMIVQPHTKKSLQKTTNAWLSILLLIYDDKYVVTWYIPKLENILLFYIIHWVTEIGPVKLLWIFQTLSVNFPLIWAYLQ